MATVPPVESDADLLTFFSPDEFGTEAVITSGSGDIPVSGIMDTMADAERPGANSRSGSSPFLVGATDAKIQRLQFTTPFAPIASVRAEDRMNIPALRSDGTPNNAAGNYAGDYRIRDIQRDGEVCRLLLNKA